MSEIRTLNALHEKPQVDEVFIDEETGLKLKAVSTDDCGEKNPCEGCVFYERPSPGDCWDAPDCSDLIFQRVE